jgi:Trypsin-co-occurring domain 1
VERGVQEIELPGGETVLASVRVLRPEQLPDRPSEYASEYGSEYATEHRREYRGAHDQDIDQDIDEDVDEDVDFRFEDTGVPERLTARVEQLNELVSGVGSAVLDAAKAAKPQEVSATFGVEIMVKPGKAVAMLADGEVKGAISVTLTWRPGEERPQQEQ